MADLVLGVSRAVGLGQRYPELVPEAAMVRTAPVERFRISRLAEVGAGYSGGGVSGGGVGEGPQGWLGRRLGG